jgi:hypothetical protein
MTWLSDIHTLHGTLLFSWLNIASTLSGWLMYCVIFESFSRHAGLWDDLTARERALILGWGALGFFC